MLSGCPLDKPEPTSPGRNRQPGSPASRPPELEDWLNRNIYHRLSIRLADWLARTFVTPNMVSIAGGIVVVIAGVVYVRSDSPVGAVVGLLLHMSWHVLDGADGDLARLTGRASKYGEMIDGLCDYISHIVLYLLLASVLAEQIGWIGWVLMVATGLARIPQTVFYETQRRQYQWWVHGKEWLRVSSDPGEPASGGFTGVARLYLWASAKLESGGRKLDALMQEMSAAQRKAVAASIAEQYRPVLAPLSLLSSNYRTLGIGISMILGAPLLYVVFELVGLTVLTAILMGRARRVIADVTAQAAERIAR